MTTSQDIQSAHALVAARIGEVEARIQHETMPPAERDELQRACRKWKHAARDLWGRYIDAANAERKIPELERVVGGKRQAVSRLNKELVRAERAFAAADEDLSRTKRADIRVARDAARRDIERLEAHIRLVEFGPTDARSAGLSFSMVPDTLLAVIEPCGLRERDIVHGHPLVTAERLLDIANARLSTALDDARKALASVGIAVAAEVAATP